MILEERPDAQSDGEVSARLQAAGSVLKVGCWGGVQAPASCPVIRGAPRCAAFLVAPSHALLDPACQPWGN